MEENLHNDHLEDRFRKSLEPVLHNASSDGWDVPSDSVWDRIEGDINPPISHTPRKRWAWLLLLLLIPIGFLGWYYGMSRQTMHTTTETNALAPIPSQTVSPSFGHIEVNASAVPSTALTSPSALPLSSPTLVTTTELNVNTLQSGIPQKTISLSPVPTEASSVLPIDTTFSKTTPLSPTQKDSFPEFAVVQTPDWQVSTLTLPLRKPTVFSTRHADFATWAVESQVSEIDEPKRKRFSLGFYFSPVYANRTVSSETGNPDHPLIQAFRQQERAKFSNDAGLQIGYHISDRWSVYSGIRRLDVRRISRHNILFHYTEQNAQTDPDGNISNTYRSTISTSYGKADVNFQLQNRPRHDGNDLQEGDPIYVRFNSGQHFRFASIPLLVEYRFGRGPFRLAFKGGFVSHHLTHEELRVEVMAVSAFRPRLRHAMTDIESSFQDLRKVNFDAQIGLGLQYYFSDRVNLSVEPIFKKSLTAIHQDLTQEIRTYPFYLGIDAGVSFHF